MSDEVVSNAPDGAFGLVMPFVVCASHGGPFADGPFVAGYECGFIDALLQSGPPELVRYVRTENVRQIDLIAMRHDYWLTSEPWADCPDEWTLVTLTKPPA